MSERIELPVSSTWTVRLRPPVQGDAGWRARTLQAVRPEVERRLQQQPDARQFILSGRLLQVEVTHEAGDWHPGAPLRLRFDEEEPPLPMGRNGAGREPLPPATVLPDARLGRLGARLVGLDTIRQAVLLQLRCRWDHGPERWARATGDRLSPALRAALLDSVPLFAFYGDPGVGKSALAQVIAHDYCRETGRPGHLFPIGTDVRGSGLVGDFGQQLRARFAEAVALSGPESPCFILMDEADAVAVRRSDTHRAHHEDAAGTATLIQLLDSLRPEQRVAIFLTTNLLTTVDAAVRRRGTAFGFPRPNLRARRRLLAQFLPQAGRLALTCLAAWTRGQTPVDIEQAISQAWLAAAQASVPLTVGPVLRHLRRQSPTGGV